MSPREQAVAAVAKSIAVQMTKRHESLPEDTYNRFLQSNYGIAEVRAREAVNAIESAGLVIQESLYSPPGPGDAIYEADFYLGSMLLDDIGARPSIIPPEIRKLAIEVGASDSDVNANGYAGIPDSDFYAGQGD